MLRRIEESVDLCDGHSLLRLSDLHDFVAGADLAFLQDAEVEPRPAAGCQQCGHPGLVHPNADAIAGNARLSDLEQRAADLITVADVHGIVGQSLDREVFTELSVDEVGPLQLLLPIAIRFDLVDEDGLLLTPVADQVALTVSFQIQPADPTAATHRILPDRGVYSATLPLDITRKSDIHRQQSRHFPLHFDADRKCFLTARSRRGHATGLMHHLADVKVCDPGRAEPRLARLRRSSASQRRAALLTTTSSARSSSLGEAPMMLRTSAVALLFKRLV